MRVEFFFLPYRFHRLGWISAAQPIFEPHALSLLIHMILNPLSSSISVVAGGSLHSAHELMNHEEYITLKVSLDWMQRDFYLAFFMQVKICCSVFIWPKHCTKTLAVAPQLAICAPTQVVILLFSRDSSDFKLTSDMIISFCHSPPNPFHFFFSLYLFYLNQTSFLVTKHFQLA